MPVLVVIAAGLGLLGLGSRFYGRFIEREIGVDPNRLTPAQMVNDGRDYVPTRRPVVFAHHFSTIAGAGPILGPTVAVLYGFVPAIIWVIFGAVLIGAVHDFTALFASVREGGRSMAEVARQTMGRVGFALFCGFTVVLLVLVTSAFLDLTCKALTSLWPIDKLGLAPDQTLLRTQLQDGVVVGRVGGIASSSVIVVTALAPLLGYLIYKRQIHTGLAFVLASALCVGSVIIGIRNPVMIDPDVWALLLAGYVLLASGAPVWVILQPRDFVNSQILYGGIALIAIGTLSAGAGGLSVSFPAFNVAEGVGKLGLLWPMMFVTIACGAISGFHSLVASGTTAKQCTREQDTKVIGYDGMLLEGALAVLVLVAVGSTLGLSEYRQVVWDQSNPALGFALATGRLIHDGIPYIPVALATVFGILMLEGFLVTTLDSAVRLNRYVFEELWGVLFASPPRIMRQYWFNAGLSVALMLLFAKTSAWKHLWPAFGAANQLLASLTLMVVTAWLLKRGRRAWYTFVPAVLMMATTLFALGILFTQYLRDGKTLLLGADIVLFGLAIALVVVAVRARLSGRLLPPTTALDQHVGAP